MHISIELKRTEMPDGDVYRIEGMAAIIVANAFNWPLTTTYGLPATFFPIRDAQEIIPRLRRIGKVFLPYGEARTLDDVQTLLLTEGAVLEFTMHDAEGTARRYKLSDRSASNWGDMTASESPSLPYLTYRCTSGPNDRPEITVLFRRGVTPFSFEIENVLYEH